MLFRFLHYGMSPVLINRQRINGDLKQNLLSSQNWFLLAKHCKKSPHSETHGMAFSVWEELVNFVFSVRLKFVASL